LNKKGFTLIEVLVGMVLLAIGLLAIAGMQMTSVRGNFFSSNMTQASILAQDRMEALKNLPYADPALTVGTHNDGLIAGTIFTRNYDVSLVPGTTMLNIRVRVSWTDTNDHAITFSTVRSE
jgi:type IV pilus assembly protein PilV